MHMPLSLPALDDPRDRPLVHGHRLSGGARAHEIQGLRAPRRPAIPAFERALPRADERAREHRRVPARRCGSTRGLGNPRIAAILGAACTSRDASCMRSATGREARQPRASATTIATTALALAWVAALASVVRWHRLRVNGRRSGDGARPIARKIAGFARPSTPTASMNAPLAASLLSAVELAPRDPILGVTEAYVADTNPKQGQSRRRRVQRRQRQAAGARVRQARRARHRRQERAARLPADRRHSRVRPRGAEAAVRRRQPAHHGRPRRHRAGARRHGRTQGRRRLPAHVRARRAGVDQRSELGEPSRAVRGRGIHRQHVRVLRRGDARPRLSPACSRRSSAFRPAASSCCMRAATTPRASIPTPEQWGRILDVVRARGLVPFLDIAYQGFADGIDADGAVVRRFAATPGPLFVSSSFSKSFSLYGERVGAMSVVATDKRRSRARAVADQARRARQLLESADARRRDRGDGAGVAGAARAVGSGARRRCATASSSCARRWSSACTSACPGATSATCSTQRGMFSYSGPDQGAGAAAARGVLDLRRGHRPHLRRGAQFAQRRLRRRCDRRRCWR